MDSAYHFAEAERCLTTLATMGPELPPETCRLWLEAASVYAQLAAVALEAEKTLGAVMREPWVFALNSPQVPADQLRCACTA